MFKCERCGKEIDGNIGSYNTHLKFCGVVLEKTFKCDHCDKSFTTKAALTNHINNYTKVKIKKYKRLCDECGSPTNNPKFCSRKCMSSGFKKMELFSKMGKQNFIHLKSKESIEKMRNSLLKTHKERRDYLYKTINFEDLPKNLIRKILFEENGKKCSECNYDFVDENGMGPYEIHHIDGNRNNWKRENVRIVCLNCHWKTSNYKFKGRKHSEKSKKNISESTRKRLSSSVG